jgi:hypothetical protein
LHAVHGIIAASFEDFSIMKRLPLASFAFLVALAPAVHAAQQGAMMLWALDREGSLPDRVRDAVRAVLRDP